MYLLIDFASHYVSEEPDEEPFLLIAIMAYGAFALFFNVDKIMTLILSYNEPAEDEGKYLRVETSMKFVTLRNSLLLLEIIFTKQLGQKNYASQFQAC